MSPILLDTHVAVWLVEGVLSGKTTRELEKAAQGNELLLSPISAWELGMLVRKRRVSVEKSLEDYVSSLYSRPGVLTAALTPAVAAASTQLTDTVGKDPADRILIATAATYGARLATRDARILQFAKATGHIACLAC